MTAELVARLGSAELRFALEMNRVLLLGRSNQADLQLPQDWTLVSGRHLELQLDSDSNGQPQLSVRDGCDGRASTNGTLLEQTVLPADRWTTVPAEQRLQIGQPAQAAVHLWLTGAGATGSSSSSDSAGIGSETPLPPQGLTIGRGSQCDVQVEGPTISRVHCLIKAQGGAVVLVDQSQNGVFVNDLRVQGQTELQVGDAIKIGTTQFQWLGDRLERSSSGRQYRIDVRNLWLKGRVNNANLSIEPGQLVAFVGGSGAGKSSLLTTIVGQNMGYSGTIRINGSELRHSYEAIKQEIGFVPQDDIVHLDLTVEEVLRYSARLKLPDREQQRQAVERVLQELEIGHRRKALVRNLSGGQRKRVSIGVELIADPRILCLDEPTSGLDPGLDKRMMQLLRSLADAGRTVMLVTHATNNVMLCDQVVFLGRGGHLCYAGPPQHCATHFGVEGDFADIYQHLETSDEAIAAIAEATRSQQQLPALGEAGADGASGTASQTRQRLGVGLIVQLLQQFTTLLLRDATLGLRDRTSLLLNCLTTPVAIALISFAANDRGIFLDTQKLDGNSYPDGLRALFVIVCAAIWVGLSTSLQALVKERPIFRRERSFNLLPEAYVASKTAWMGLQAVLQALMIMVAASLFFDPPLGQYISWPLAVGLVGLLTLVSIGAQSLLVSSLVTNSQQASSAAPLLLIPQL
ncbi:MAG: ATP-binding cassette domain-containing protein, partial [Cyanobacteria bacterium K_DeepCast_35m_m2_023]|nr:ATP-binding cassette domain-containing protein [Cyanobacteria bacterium K_DeepCast_35m_m2_023]